MEIESGGEKVELPLLNGLVSRPTSVAAKTQLQPVGNKIMSGEMDLGKVGGYMELGDLLSAGLIIYISDPQCDDINPVPPGKSSSLAIF